MDNDQKMLFWCLVQDALKVHGEGWPETDAEIDAWLEKHPMSKEDKEHFEAIKDDVVRNVIADCFVKDSNISYKEECETLRNKVLELEETIKILRWQLSEKVKG